MSWLDSEGHSRPPRWWRHPCRCSVVEVIHLLVQLVLASESALSCRSLVVVEDRMRQGHWLRSVISALTLWVWWQAGHPACRQTCSNYPQSFCTWSTSAFHAPQLCLGSVSDPPADNFGTYRATGWVLLPDGLSLWQACRFGTQCQSTWETWPSAETFSENSWKRFCLQRTNAYSALEVLWQWDIQIHITFTFTLKRKCIHWRLNISHMWWRWRVCL